MFDSDTQGFYKSEQQESSIMRRSFNPHALQRSAPLLHVGAVYHHEFQSTRPMRGATTQALNTHRGLVVSIHAPRVGRDNVGIGCGLGNIQFQSTRPVWGATPLTDVSHTSSCFNPRAPCGARLAANVPHTACPTFQSTRPVWGATRCRSTPEQGSRVSIHAPRVGRDIRSISQASLLHLFQSTRPVWGATLLLHLLTFP